jgi:hypothetical protein
MAKNLLPPLFGQKYKLEFAIIHLSWPSQLLDSTVHIDTD